MRSPQELELAEHIYFQLHKLGLESLTNLKFSVLAEIERKKNSASLGPKQAA